MIDGDVDDLVRKLRYVAGPNVVPAPVGERWIEHRLVGEIGFGHARIEHWRAKLFERLHDLLPFLDGSRITARDAHNQLAVQLPGHERKRWRLPVDHDRHKLVRCFRDPLAVETQDLR